MLAHDAEAGDLNSAADQGGDGDEEEDQGVEVDVVDCGLIGGILRDDQQRS